MSNIVGIDLGTSYCRVAVFRNGGPEVIPNEYGNRSTPSCVAFTADGVLVGEAAASHTFEGNTVSGAYRLIGCNFVQINRKHWPFEVVAGEGGRADIQVQLNGSRTFSPEQIASFLMHKMKQLAEAFIGSPVIQAIVSVPCTFDYNMRRAIEDAGAIAGLRVFRVFSGSSLAASAYSVDHRDTDERNVLTFDLGGGSLDVSVSTIEDGIVEMKSMVGDAHLGGNDFTNRMVNHCVDEFNRKNRKDLFTDSDSIRCLRAACDVAKWELSTSAEASITIKNLYEGIDFHTTISRARFEELCADLFRYTLNSVEWALRDAKVDKSRIDEIVVVGGSSRIPKVQQLLSEFFNGKELNRTINPDEAVVRGAAIQVGIVPGDKSEGKRDMLLIDIIPLSLGVDDGGSMWTIAQCGTTYPTKTSRSLAVRAADKPGVTIRVFEGDEQTTKDNLLLGTLELPGLAANEEHNIEITFDISDNCIVTVTAKDQDTGVHNSNELTGNRRSQEVIDRMSAELAAMVVQAAPDRKRQREDDGDVEFEGHAKTKKEEETKDQVKEENARLRAQVEELKSKLEHTEKKYRSVLMKLAREK